MKTSNSHKKLLYFYPPSRINIVPINLDPWSSSESAYNQPTAQPMILTKYTKEDDAWNYSIPFC
jgi:hypothetical protein